MKLVALAALVAATALLGGCETNPRKLGVNLPGEEGTKPANIGPIITDIVKSRLKDPYSAVIEVGEPEMSRCMVGSAGYFHGWRVPVEWNAKNDYGAYVGTKSEYWWFQGSLLKRVSTDPTGYCWSAR